MNVFLDFESSSLAKRSFPVEVAWVFEDGRSKTFLIRPALDWTDWSDEAEAIHGITRQQLFSEGLPVTAVASEMISSLTGNLLYASAPSWDGKWLSTLLRSAGYPRHTLRLAKSDEAFRIAARAALGPDIPETEIASLVTAIIEGSAPPRPAHRALPDAMLELHRWQLCLKLSRTPPA